MKGFHITSDKGFHITFENGYTVSVQFGPGNYCDNYERQIGQDERACGKEGSRTAECAVWAAARDLIVYEGFNGNTVGNRMTPAEVLTLMNWAASQPKEVTCPAT